MALETTINFARHLIDVSAQERKIKAVSLQILDNTVVKARFRLNRRFIDVFYNSQTGTTAYALIESEKRIFGIDNTGNWHLYPKEKPDSHKKCKPVFFEEFLKQALKV